MVARGEADLVCGELGGGRDATESEDLTRAWAWRARS